MFGVRAKQQTEPANSASGPSTRTARVLRVRVGARVSARVRDRARARVRVRVHVFT